MKTAPFLLVQ